MTDARATASLTQHARLFEAGAHVVAAAFVGGAPMFALADGAVLIGEPEDHRRVVAHPDAVILTAISDGKMLLTGGDDGRVVAIQADGASREIADEKGRWIDALAMRGKAYAWSAGKQVRARDETGTVKTWSAPSTARGLAFQPKGYRLAATHYNGATLWFPKVEGMPQTLEWKGAHLDAAFSPDGRFLVTSMQENALHGWRLADSAQHAHDRLPGQDALALLVARRAVACDLGRRRRGRLAVQGQGRADGQAPRECGVRQARVTRVAFHPKALVVAIGYADGVILLCRLADAAEIPVRDPGGGPVSALSWDATGARLLFGLETGAAGVLNLPA